MNENLNHLHYTIFMDMTTKNTIKPCSEYLPPPDNAARFHFYRVHYQVAQWRTLTSTDLTDE